MEKHTAAPAMAEVQDRMAPCHQPNRLALASVMKNAGSGAATDWKIISRKDTAMAQGPYLAMKARMASKSPVRNMSTRELTAWWADGTAR